MRIDVVNGNNMFVVSLRNDKEKVEFNHAEIKTYAVNDRKAEGVK